MLNFQLRNAYPKGNGWRAGRIRALVGLFIALFGSACATPYNPFAISDSELRDRIKTIALAPLSANPFLVDAEFARKHLYSLATARLVAGGFQVVPAKEMEKVWLSLATEVGEIFDPISGQTDKERYQAVKFAVYRDLHANHGVDAVLYLTVTTNDIQIPVSPVPYCGRAAEELYLPEQKMGFGARLAGNHPTLARVLCLETTLFDMEGRRLYGIRGGLEIYETYAWQTRYTRPLKERMHDLERLRQVIEDIVGPLADAGNGR